jgi:hypothetical protein
VIKKPALPPIYGLMAEFDAPGEIVTAAEKVMEAGYRKVEGYTPYPIEELSEALDHHKSYVPLLVLIGGITGCLAGYGLEYYTQVISYPMNIGGKPVHSWPAFIPPAFETTILFGAISAVFGMLALNGLPMPYHPVFNVPRFVHASRDRFFLVIESVDPKFQLDETRRFLQGLGALAVSEVDH